MRIFKIPALLAALFIAAAAAAAEPPYLTPQQIDLPRYLPTPATNGSADLAQQLQMVLAIQGAASPERIAQANVDAKGGVFHIFGAVVGPEFTAAKLPQTERFFKRLEQTERHLLDATKKTYDTKRPYLSHPDIKALVKISSGDAYPSGHTAGAALSAIVLADLVPEKRAAIFARARDYAQSRIVGGMHYPQDIEGGRLAATAIAVALYSNAAFLADLETAKKELHPAPVAEAVR